PAAELPGAVGEAGQRREALHPVPVVPCLIDGEGVRIGGVRYEERDLRREPPGRVVGFEGHAPDDLAGSRAGGDGRSHPVLLRRVVGGNQTVELLEVAVVRVRRRDVPLVHHVTAARYRTARSPGKRCDCPARGPLARLWPWRYSPGRFRGGGALR